jgi:diguanylate cyclase (GGDEF)-like protein
MRVSLDGHTMMHPLTTLGQRLDRFTRAQIFALGACSVLLVGAVDYLTGYEISMSVFYLAPVAMAAWYAERRTGIAIAVLSCITWYSADLAAGNQYSHPAIPVWNALVRFGFFLITALLLTTLRKSLRSHQHLARTDALTGLYGRRAFEDRLEHDLALAQRRKEALTLAYVDVDDFRAVNDAHGHAGGDRVLREIGRVLKASLREADTAARVGGDEFALVFPDTDARGAHQIVAKLTRELREVLGLTSWGVTCSIGVVTFLESATSPERAVAAADEVMYQVKHRGKGAVEFSVYGEAVQPGAPADRPTAAAPLSSGR